MPIARRLIREPWREKIQSRRDGPVSGIRGGGFGGAPAAETGAEPRVAPRGRALGSLPLHLGALLAVDVAARAGQALRLEAQQSLEAPPGLEDWPVRHLPVPEEGLDADLREGVHLHLKVRARQVEVAAGSRTVAPRARGELRDGLQPVGEHRAEA